MSIDVEYIECPDCEGSGHIDPTDHLDLDDIGAVLKELTAVVNSPSKYGIRSSRRPERLVALARVGWLAARVVWLESVEQNTEDMKARIEQATDKVAAVADELHDRIGLDDRNAKKGYPHTHEDIEAFNACEECIDHAAELRIADGT